MMCALPLPLPEIGIPLDLLACVAMIPTFVSVAVGGAFMLLLVSYGVVRPHRWKQ